ncbi:hypothetical protein KAFR_0A03150 [Kazachstania africana CBS 2517]|uniref:Uncharacterized protein n=1 Tax=Kazachstania africana (strain ATCC 22294 / BCRC 22015 / CBS 2517 / CECT 1963 / NBRC 1671 / NRRL Y-8276) TaxID=1071382 RepID=H2AN00_KAZAF|nr:hypothetical protein KAFR_0A03150 [Kazachstania africana CBS 2517]CCF55750.1 hypothetical protein KAFR_0A03150 [Kazachstania africana CBS 2517]
MDLIDQEFGILRMAPVKVDADKIIQDIKADHEQQHFLKKLPLIVPKRKVDELEDADRPSEQTKRLTSKDSEPQVNETHNSVAGAYEFVSIGISSNGKGIATSEDTTKIISHLSELIARGSNNSLTKQDFAFEEFKCQLIDQISSSNPSYLDLRTQNIKNHVYRSLVQKKGPTFILKKYEDQISLDFLKKVLHLHCSEYEQRAIFIEVSNVFQSDVDVKTNIIAQFQKQLVAFQQDDLKLPEKSKVLSFERAIEMMFSVIRLINYANTRQFSVVFFLHSLRYAESSHLENILKELYETKVPICTIGFFSTSPEMTPLTEKKQIIAKEESSIVSEIIEKEPSMHAGGIKEMKDFFMIPDRFTNRYATLWNTKVKESLASSESSFHKMAKKETHDKKAPEKITIGLLSSVVKATNFEELCRLVT